ncbi:DMT family transporter [Alloyangia pacifica]|uniref:DMT family transporter n=1 Tax=Alloyangia pacifica TaxID=311180 RepID=UPI001CD4866C|nr:EamA family transporter [Alloyangia pacifica]MCA0998119.1 EamA family transporter [Alloyangia pacifica]
MTDLTSPRHATTESHALTLSALAALFWGSNFEATRIALDSLPPWSAAAGRFGIAAIATLAWMRWQDGPGLAALRRNWPAMALLGLIGVAGFNAALFLSMRTSSPVTGALIMATTPLTTNLLDAFLSRRLPSVRMVLGMAVGLLGVALTVGAFSGARFGSGDLLILAGSLCWSLYTVGCRRWISEATPLETSAWTMAFGAAVLVGAACLIETPVAAITAASPAGWGATLWMAIAGSTLAFAFWQTGIRTRGPGATSVLFNLVPVSALVIVAGFGRMPDVTQILGVVIAIAGVLWASRGRT